MVNAGSSVVEEAKSSALSRAGVAWPEDKAMPDRHRARGVISTCVISTTPFMKFYHATIVEPNGMIFDAFFVIAMSSGRLHRSDNTELKPD